jgi:probable HAF family extracellular repeat protein
MKTLSKMKVVKAVAIFAGLMLTCATPARAQRTYTVTDLGAVAGAFVTDPTDINNRGEAAVTSIFSFRQPRPTFGFVSKDGVMTLLPGLGGQFTFASAINDSGIVAGSSTLAGDTITHAAIWDSDLDQVTDLGTLGGATSAALWLNNRRQAVGDSETSNGTDFHAFLWDRGVMTDLGTLGGSFSFAFAINDSQLIVGQSDTTTTIDPVFGLPTFHGFVWERGVLSDLGEIFGGHFNYAQYVNDGGDIVGAADLAGDLTGHAFKIRNGSLIDLGAVAGDTNSAALGANNRGQIVGISGLSFEDPTFGPPVNTFQCPCHAAIWEDGTVTDLNTVIPAGSGWQLVNALAINDRGQIVGSGTLNNEFRAFLLTPQDGHGSSRLSPAANVSTAAAASAAPGASAGATRIRIVSGSPRIIHER